MPLGKEVGLGPGHIVLDGDPVGPSPPQHIWISWNIDIPRRLNSRDSFPSRKFENRSPISYRSGSILSPSTIRIELHAKVAEEIDLEICSYEQLSEVQILHNLDLDLRLGQGHTNIHSTRRAQPCHCSITHYRNMPIWISWNIDIRRSLNSRDSFPRKNSKIRLR